MKVSAETRRGVLGCLRSLTAQVLASALLVAILAGSVPTKPVSAQQVWRAVPYTSPVDAAVIDPFRPPAHVGAAGNRGLEYDTTTDVFVVAAADGFVTFSGAVAGRQIITIHHPDNVRTTYTGLNTRWAQENEFVAQGQVIGRTGPGFHFGARSGGHYLDPQVLLDASTPELKARLVPQPNE